MKSLFYKSDSALLAYTTHDKEQTYIKEDIDSDLQINFRREKVEKT